MRRYNAEVRQKAVQMYVDGINLRRIARHLGVNHQSVANWAKTHADGLPTAPVPGEVENAEMDELFTFIGDKKNRIYIITIVDRKTRCILCWVVVWERTQEAIQLMIDDAPKSKWYFSDGFRAYGCLWYHYGRYEVSEGKNDTYSVEGERHYLARLARRSRCFSRCPYALQCALKLFVFAFNRRQLHKQAFTNYQTHVKDFIYP
jgi:IS1 family transposase